MLARLQYLNINGVFCQPSRGAGGGALPGECFWYQGFDRYRIGITIHLATILPAGLIAVFQFLPVVRYKAILYHRIAGYVAILLALVSTFSALVIVDRAFGGEVSTQALVGFLGVISPLGLANAYYNIKRKQIDQHRAWMLRSWFWMASIISLRIIMFIAATILSMPSYRAGNQYHADIPCPQILWTLSQYNASLASLSRDDQAAYLAGQYPSCEGEASNLFASAPVDANLNGDSAVEVAAVFHISFGMAGILALILHAIGVEVYLQLTPKEAERLRTVSYQKQLEAGMHNPGSAGLVPEKLGDMDPWVPPEQRPMLKNAETARAESQSSSRLPQGS